MNWTVDEIIPQRDPFVFIDDVVSFSEDEIKTTFEIKANQTLVHEGLFQEAGLVENMAQTAAALEGCNAKSNNSKVKIGFIGSIKKLEITRTPKIGKILETKIKILTNAMGVNVAEGIVNCEGKLIAKCIINIFLKED